MKYTERYKIKWHDTDADRKVRPSMLLVYMQETANLQFVDAGESLDSIRDRTGMAYILSKLRLKIYKPLFAYEDISVETWICPSRGYSSVRCFRINRGGETVAEGDSVWAIIDLADKKLCRADSVNTPFEPDEPLTLDVPNHAKIPRDLTPEQVGKRTILYSDIDYNMHMNNTRYPDMLCDYMPYEKISHIRSMSLSYLHEAALGDTLDIMRADDGKSYYFKTVNQNGTVCLEATVICDE